MFRSVPHIVLFVVAVLSQVFIFDNLLVGVSVAPMVYIIVIALLPLELKRITLLGAGVLLGVVMDAVMGTGGLNSIATIFVAYMRPPIVRLLIGQERAIERGVPSEITFGAGSFLRYLVVFIAIHHLVFFLFEALSLHFVLFTTIRFLLSTLVSILFVWLISHFISINNFLK